MTEIGLDIGTRNTPLINLVRKDLFPEGSKYIFIDKRYGWMSNLHKWLKGSEVEDLLTSLGQKLPFKDNSISVIFAKDLFGADGFLATQPDGTYDMEDVGTGFADEWFRVCKKGGKVVIMEVSTPPDMDLLKKEFLNVGFEVDEVLKGQEAWNVLRYKTDFEGLSGSDDFSLVFKKP